MGRSKKIKSEKEKKEQRERWWGKKRNEVRRKRYADDPIYREHVTSKHRERYQSGKGTVLRSCSANITMIGSFSVVRNLGSKEDKDTQATLSVGELGEALGGYTKQTMYKWCGRGQFPKPTHKAIGDRGCLDVFTIGEATVLLRVFSLHQKSFVYFRKTHIDTINKLFAAVP